MASDRGVRLQAHRLVRAPVHRVWQLLSRLESHPRFATLWLVAELLERSQSSAIVEFRGFFGGLPVTSVQRVVLRPPGRIEFRQTRGTLRGLEGAYLLKDVGGDTDLQVQLSVDAGIVMFSDAAVQQIVAAHLDGTLGRIKAAAERDLVRLVPRRLTPAGEPVALPEAHDDDVQPATPASLPGRSEGDDVGPPGAEIAAARTAEASRSGEPQPAHAEARGRRRRRRRRHRSTRPPAGPTT